MEPLSSNVENNDLDMARLREHPLIATWHPQLSTSPKNPCTVTLPCNRDCLANAVVDPPPENMILSVSNGIGIAYLILCHLVRGTCWTLSHFRYVILSLYSLCQGDRQSGLQQTVCVYALAANNIPNSTSQSCLSSVTQPIYRYQFHPCLK